MILLRTLAYMFSLRSIMRQAHRRVGCLGCDGSRIKFLREFQLSVLMLESDKRVLRLCKERVIPRTRGEQTII